MDPEDISNKRERTSLGYDSMTLYQRLLKSKAKFHNQFDDQKKITDIVAQNNSEWERYIYGQVNEFKLCIADEKREYRLENQRKFYQFALNEKYLIVIVSQLSNHYPNKTPIALYLPTSMTVQPKQMIGDLQLVIIQKFQQIQGQNLMQYPYVIVEPDQYLSPTGICQWLQCNRLVSLTQYYLKSSMQSSEALTYGNACHSFLEYLLNNLDKIKNKNLTHFQPQLKNIYQKLLYQFYIILKLTGNKIEFERFFQQCQNSLKNIYDWVIKHIVEGKTITHPQHRHLELKITNVIGSETMHTSNYFSLRGTTDGLFTGICNDKLKNMKYKVLIPFELKTGKEYEHHKQQLDYYNILLREKQNIPAIGILYYSKSSLMFLRIQSADLAFKNIVINRNNVLLDLNRLYKSDKIELPKFAFGLNQCKKCRSATNCESLHIVNRLQQTGRNYFKKIYQTQQEIQPQNIEKQQENVKEKTPSDVNKYSKINDLESPQIKYIQKWMICLHAEEMENRISKFQKKKENLNRFALQCQELEKIKEFFSVPRQSVQRLKLIVEKKLHSVEEYEMIRSAFKISRKVRCRISYLGVLENCKIISKNREASKLFLSLEFINQQIEYSKGYLDKGISEKIVRDVLIENCPTNQFSNLRNTVFDFVTGKNEALKKLIIPEYEENTILRQRNKKKYPFPVEVLPIECEQFNFYQKNAFKNTFSEQYCTLIEGMPGTGKTQLIVKILQKCYEKGLKVLVTTYTNRSLDNIILRTKDKVNDKSIIRQGSKQSIDKNVVQYHSSIITQKFKDIYEYKNYFDGKTIWFVTLSSVNSAHIPNDFDLVILDEASQSLEPACIAALVRGKKIVLIGDFKQLQPIVKSKKAIQKEMNISLFERLCRKGGNIVSLRYQYRMNKEIMKLSNLLVYDGQLDLDPEKKAERNIQFCQDWKAICEINDVIDIVSPQKPVIFLDHDYFLQSLNGNFENQKEQIMHILEVDLAIFLLKKFLQLGIKLQDMAIVCVYNNTVDEIRDYLQQNNLIVQNKQQSSEDREQGQVLTIDKSQGIDKELIILLAESRQTTNNTLLQDHRRLNVALTRAKTKLVMIGSMNYLQNQNTVFSGKLPKLLRGKEYSIGNQLVHHSLLSMNE